MDGDSICIVLRRQIASKSRPVPAMLKYGFGEEARFQTQVFSDPSEDLLESYIAVLARERLRRRSDSWDTSGEYTVDIDLGQVAGGSSTDLDNVAKLVLDGLTGVLWDADNHVIDLRIRRGKAGSGSRYTVVTVFQGTVA